jgi:hypothetical protein
VSQGIIPARMPDKYIVEMFMDRIAASKTYNRDNYDDSMPLKYYRRGKPGQFMEENTKELLEKLLVMLANEGEEACFDHIRKHILYDRPSTWLAGYLAHRKE